jgi:hypothetical protein
VGADAVWIAEEEELPGPDGGLLLGTFCGHHESGHPDRWPRFVGLDAQAAIEWGRARSSTVFIRLGDGRGYFSAGELCPTGEPRWPPPDLPQLRRRRPPDEAWKERTVADPAIDWAVSAWLVPPEWSPRAWQSERTSWDQTVAAFAARSQAESWDAQELEAMAASIDKAAARAAPSTHFGWSHSTAAPHAGYRVGLREHASTREQAVEGALSRCPPPDGWILHFTARPHQSAR